MKKKVPFSPAASSDEELLRLARRDEAAFDELLRRTERQVYSLAFALVQNREDAEDVTQETYLRVWQSLSSFRGECSVKTWILRVARNASLDVLRRRASHEVLPLTTPGEDGEEIPLEIPDPDDTPDAAAIRSLEIREVRAAIAALPADAREILVLRDLQELSYAELSDLLGLPEGTVKSRLFRARAALKKLLLSRNIF